MDRNQTQKPLRAVISARVSVDDFGKGRKTREEQQEQASISIEAQIDAANALIEREGYQLVCDPLVDDGVSGFKGAERKGFDALVRMIIRGEVDIVVARAVDRIGRNDADNSQIRMAATDAGVRFHLTSGGMIDPRESGGKLNMQMMQGIAEYQSAQKSETLRNVYGAMRERGELRSGHKAFGWQWEKGKPELSMLEVPAERELVQEAYARVLGGGREYTRRGRPLTADRVPESLYSICADWNARKIPSVTGKEWSITAMRSMLLRPSNALYIRDGAGWNYLEGKRGKWDRLIDDETYAAARALLTSESRRTAPGRKSTHLVSGIVRCGLCGGVLRSSSVDDKAGGRIPIYRCTNKISMPSDRGVRHVSARISQLDGAVRRAVVAAFMFGPVDLFPDEAPSRASDIHDELDQVIDAQNNLQELVKLKLRKPMHIAADMRELNAREAALRAELETATASDADSLRLSDLRAGLWRPGRINIDQAATYAIELGSRFDALPIERRRALVRYLLDVSVRPLAKGVYGPRRWKIEHKVVTHLNDDEMVDVA